MDTADGGYRQNVGSLSLSEFLCERSHATIMSVNTEERARRGYLRKEVPISCRAAHIVVGVPVNYCTKNEETPARSIKTNDGIGTKLVKRMPANSYP